MSTYTPVSTASYIHAAPCTVVTYGYKASNGKQTQRSVWFEGTMSPREIAGFQWTLEEQQLKADFFGIREHGIYLIPEQVGLRPLQEDVQHDEDSPKPLDHAFHLLLSVESFNRPPNGVRHDRQERSIEAFMKEFVEVEFWDVTRSQVVASQVSDIDPDFSAVKAVVPQDADEELFDPVLEHAV